MASAAKAAVKNFIGNSGHKTTVEEHHAPAVTNETVKPHQHENITTAVDREIHQDHHHTTVQPLTHREVLPEEHHHNVLPVEHKTFDHGNEHDVRAKLEQEAAKFKNTSTTHETKHTSTTAPTAESERVHHHIHEHVQPVIHKETVAPKVVHTTVPVHETHHAAAQHHGTSTLPAKSLDEFTSAGGFIDGKGQGHRGEYEGCPRPYNHSLQSEQTEADRDMHKHSHIGGDHDYSHSHGTHTGVNGGLGNSTHTGMNDGLGRSTHNDGLGRSTHNDGLGRSTHNDGLGHSNTTSSSATATGTHKKPSLLDRLNPKKDTDGDGKTGFMD